MTPAQLVALARADGVTLSLFPSGRLRITGDTETVARWLAVIAPPAYRDAIVEELRAESVPLLHERHAADTSAPSDAAGRVLAPAIDLTSKGLK